MGLCISDSPALIPSRGEIAVHDLCKKPFWPIRVDAVARSVKLLGFTPHSPAIFLYRHPEAPDSFVWTSRHMLHIVEECHRVVVGPQEQDLVIKAQKPV